MRHKHSRVSDPNTFFSSPGEHFKQIFSSRLNPDGTVSLSSSGRVNVQAEIDSHLAETDMALIVAKLQRGDISVLNSKQAMYGDFTTLPTTFSEAYDLVLRSESAFEALPVEVKSKFDNSRAKWFSTIGTPLWYERMGMKPPAPPAPPDPPSSSASSVVTPSSSESQVVL